MDHRSEDILFFEEEVQEHYDYLHKFLTTATKDGPLARDIVQETMATAWEKIHRLRQYKNVKYALRRIAKNKLYDHYKKIGFHKAPLPLFEISKMPSTEKDVLLRLIQKEEHSTLLSAIGDLTGEYRQVILLHYYYEQSFKDVARMTKTNYNTVVSRHRRALKALEERLREEWS